MKILIVTPLFPPQNAIGALRPYSWAKYWGRNGHDVTVLTVESYGMKSNLSTKLKNVKVITEKIPLISKLLSKFTSYSTFTNSKSKKVNIYSFSIKCCKDLLYKTGIIMGVRYPDLRDLWVGKILKKVKKNQYDFIITTGCPYSVHRIGYYFKKRNPNVFWIVDWRDLWTLNPYWKGLLPFIWIEKNLEKKYHQLANLITVVSTGLSEDLSKITSKRIEVIPNGFDSEDYQSFINKKQKKNEKLTFVYTGTIYKGVQDITPFLTAIKELSDENQITEKDLVFKAAGRTADLSENIKKYGLDSFFIDLGLLPREEALLQIYNSEIAILLLGTKNSKGILTGKLFEYLSLSKYIFGIDFSRNTEAGNILYKTNSGLCFNSDVEYIKKEILLKLRNFKMNIDTQITKDTLEISKYERKRLADRLLDLVIDD